MFCCCSCFLCVYVCICFDQQRTFFSQPKVWHNFIVIQYNIFCFVIPFFFGHFLMVQCCISVLRSCEYLNISMFCCNFHSFCFLNNLWQKYVMDFLVFPLSRGIYYGYLAFIEPFGQLLQTQLYDIKQSKNPSSLVDGIHIILSGSISTN